MGWIAGRFPKEKQILAFSGADPSVIEQSLKRLVDSPELTSIGGNNASASLSTAMILEQGEAAAAVVAGGGSTAGLEGGVFSSNRSLPTQAAPVGPARPREGYHDQRPPSGLQEGVGRGVEEEEEEIAAVGGGMSVVGAGGSRPGSGSMPLPYRGVVCASPAGSVRGGRTFRHDGSGGFFAAPMRTLGMMRAESATRAHYGSGFYGGAAIPASHAGEGGVDLSPAPLGNGFAMVNTSPIRKDVVAAAASTAGAEAAAAVPAFFGEDGGGGGGGGGVKAAELAGKGSGATSTSSTASMSSTGSSFRTRVRSSRENQLYGAWCRQVCVG